VFLRAIVSDMKISLAAFDAPVAAAMTAVAAQAHGQHENGRFRRRKHGVGVVLLGTILVGLFLLSSGGIVAAATAEAVGTTSVSVSVGEDMAAADADQADVGGLSNLSSNSPDDDGPHSPDQEEGDGDAFFDGLIGDDDDGVEAAGGAAEADAVAEAVEGRSLTQRKYVQTKELAHKGATKKGADFTEKELRLRMRRRRRRRRRRKRGQTLSDRVEQIREKKKMMKTTTTTSRKKVPAKAFPYAIQAREGGASSSDDGDKKFADRASSRTRDSGDVEGRPDRVSPQQQSDSKGRQSESGVSEDDDGPHMVSGPSVSDEYIRWRCAYPGETVMTTEFPKSISMEQQASFSPPGPSFNLKNWLKRWSLQQGGFGKTGRKGHNENDGNRRAAEQSKGGGGGGGGGGPQLVSSADVEDKLYVLPKGHRLCKTMKFVCPAICANRSDFMCQEDFTCTYRAPPSLSVSRPQPSGDERPPGQKRLPPLPISNSGGGKGKGGPSSTSRTQARDGGGKGGSSSDDFSTYKKHRDGRPRNLVEGGVEIEEDSFDADADLSEDERTSLQDSFDDTLRDLRGNPQGSGSKGYAGTPAPAGPQLINVNVQAECTSTNHQLLPHDYVICSRPDPHPEPECPKELPERGVDYDKLVEKLPKDCKEEPPDFSPPGPNNDPPVATVSTQIFYLSTNQFFLFKMGVLVCCASRVFLL